MQEGVSMILEETGLSSTPRDSGMSLTVLLRQTRYGEVSPLQRKKASIDENCWGLYDGNQTMIDQANPRWDQLNSLVFL